MHKKIYWSLFLSILFITIFPVVKQKIIDAPYRIKISVEQNTNPKSEGHEVWINYFTKDGITLENATFVLPDEWENRGRIFSSGNQSAPLEIILRYKEKCSIVFVTHPYSGIVTVETKNGGRKTIDLYSPEEGQFEYLIP